MTRQWLSDPSDMCIRHITGEHAETHMFLRKMEKHYSLQGFRDGSMFFGAPFIEERHDILAQRLRGHQSPLWISDLTKVEYPLITPTEEDIRLSNTTLRLRCADCSRLYRQHHRAGENV